MKFDIKHAEEFSRGEALLRTFFGIIYIGIPHMIPLMFIGIGVMFAQFIAMLSVLFTGKYPQGIFDFVLKYNRWNQRVSARLMNLCDGYPAFGLNGQDDYVTLEATNPEKIPFASSWMRFLFGFFYVIIPHGIVLMFYMIPAMLLMYFAWLVIAITGKYPKPWHEYMVGIARWSLRVNFFMNFMNHEYPPFSGKMTDAERNEGSGSAVPASDDLLDS